MFTEKEKADIKECIDKFYAYSHNKIAKSYAYKHKHRLKKREIIDVKSVKNV